VLAGAYCKAPAVHNELVNREKPSANANAARIKLIQAMVNHGDKQNLGIDKFPAEKGVYLSVLHKTGLHREVALNQWAFAHPDKGSPFEHVWTEVTNFLSSTSAKPKALIELNQTLMSPPYGVKAGLLPILYMAVYCAMRDELVVYEDRRFVPWLSEEHIDRFVKRPDTFTFQQFKIEGVNADLFDAYAEALTPNKPASSVLDLVRPVAVRIGRMEYFTQQTRDERLSIRARSIRDAFKLSKSPHKLLFDEIPTALSSNLSEGESDGASDIAKRLVNALEELESCHDSLVTELIAGLAECLGIDAAKQQSDLSDLKAQAQSLSSQLVTHAESKSDIAAFLTKISTSRDGIGDAQWLREILMHLVNRPTDKWTDLDVLDAKRVSWRYRINVADLRKLAIRNGQAVQQGDGDHFLLQAIKSGEKEKSEGVTIVANARDKLDSLREGYGKLTADIDRETRLALLAELLHSELGFSGEDKNADSHASEDNG